MNYKFILGLSILTIASVSRANNLLVNGSFETGNFVNNGAGAESLALGDTSMTGWTTVSAELAWVQNGNNYSLSAEDGTMSLDLTGYHDSSPYGGVEQSFATVVGGQYLLSFYVGANSNYSQVNGVNALINNSSLGTFTINSTTSGQTWQQFSVSFTASSTTSTLDIIGSAASGGTYIGLDNVSVTAQSVPEPAEFLPMVGTALGLLAFRRRKN